MTPPGKWQLAASAAWRFTREHGLARAARLGARGLVTLGPEGLVRRAAADARQAEDDTRYRHWLAAHTPDAAALERLRAEVAAWTAPPRISIVTPVFNTPPEGLRRCIASVRRQVYPHWEWCLCDDGSTDAETIAALGSLAGDPRIRIVRSCANGGIVSASNAALAAATGDFVAFLDHDDELAPDALAEVARALVDDPAADIVYTDEDKIDARGTRIQPHFKPDWSPELLRSCMYVSHLTVMRRALIERAGGLRAGTEGAQDYDLLLRASLLSNGIVHVPKVLYHWRITEGSAANSQLEKRWAVEAGQRALEEDAHRRGRPARAEGAGAAGHYRLRPQRERMPEIACVASSPAGRDVPGSAPYVLFHAAGARVPSKASLEALVDLCEQDGIGAAGGFVLDADGAIASAGIVLTGGVPRYAFEGEPGWTRGHLSNVLDVRNCAAVSGALLMTRRDVLRAVGGLDVSAGALWDVDYCLRVRAAGLRVAVTPHARIALRTARQPLPPRDLAALQDRWERALDRDPYYNPNFDRRSASFRLPVPGAEDA